MRPPIGICMVDDRLYSCFIDDEGNPIDILDPDGHPMVPSVFRDPDGEISVGTPSKENSALHSPEGLWADLASTETPMRGPYPAESLMALVAKKIIRITATSHGYEPERAMLSVPSYLGFDFRSRLTRAFMRAGFKSIDFVNPGEAVVVARGHGQGRQNSLAVRLDRLGYEVSLSDGAPGGAFLLGSRGSSSYTGADIDLKIAEIALRKSRERANIPRQAAMDSLSASRLPTLERLAASGRTSVILKDFGGTDLAVTLADSEVSRVCEKISQKVLASVRELLQDLDVASEEIESVLLVGPYSSLGCFRSKMEVLFGPGKVTLVQDHATEARGAARIAATAGNAPDRRPISMDTVLGIAIDDGSFLPMVWKTSSGMTSVTGHAALFGLPGATEACEISVLEGSNPVAARNRQIGSLVIPASGEIMELTVSLTLLNNRIFIQATGGVTSESATLAVDGPPCPGRGRYRLLSRQRPLLSEMSPGKEEIALLRIILNNAMENICFLFSTTLGTLVKASTPRGRSIRSMAGPSQKCRGCSTDLPPGAVLIPRKGGMVPGSRVSYICPSCSRKGWFKNPGFAGYRSLKFPCYSRNGNYIDSLVLLYPADSPEAIVEAMAGNTGQASSALGSTLFKILDDTLFVRGAVPGRENQATLASMAAGRPVVQSMKLKARGFSKMQMTMVVPGKVAALMIMGYRRSCSISGRIHKALFPALEKPES